MPIPQGSYTGGAGVALSSRMLAAQPHCDEFSQAQVLAWVSLVVSKVTDRSRNSSGTCHESVHSYPRPYEKKQFFG